METYIIIDVVVIMSVINNYPLQQMTGFSRFSALTVLVGQQEGHPVYKNGHILKSGPIFLVLGIFHESQSIGNVQSRTIIEQQIRQ